MQIALQLVGGLILLMLGGELLVRGAVQVATRFGVSPLVIGLTLVGFGTSTPELVTSVQAALSGSPGIAYGNIVGSNIANILLILGIAAIITPIAVSSNALKRDSTIMVLVTVVFAIVAALFVYALWITILGQQRSGFAVSLSLILLMIPVVVRNTEEMLRVVPMDLREASYALGVPKWKTIVRIVLPTALSGIVTGIMLAIARVMGESSPVLVLVGSSSVINWDAFKGSQSSLPLMMLDMYKAGAQPAVLDKLWGAALTLVILIAVLNIAARIVSAKFSVKK